MAWATKYRFRWNSVHGVEFNIYIQKDGYEGDVIQRPLGRAPLLRKKKNGPICGTSLEIYAECQVDGEFSELYTSNPKEFLVLLTRGNDTIWSGFVSTELYSEPSVAPPYDVQIVATDGLGELKLNNFTKRGDCSLSSMFVYLLSFTGKDKDIFFAWEMAEYQGSASEFLTGGLINMDYREGDKIYDVLTTILQSFNATITLHNDIWLVMRETDVANGADTYAYRVPAGGGTVTQVAIPARITSVGQMGIAAMWPIGNYSSKIEPARNSIALSSPFNYRQLFLNPELVYPYSDWSTSGDVTWGDGTIYLGYGYGASFTDGILYQGFSTQGLISAIEITFDAFNLRNSHYFVYAVYTETNSGVVHFGTKDGWSTNNPSSQLSELRDDVSEPQTITVIIPAPYYNAPGTLQIMMVGWGFNLKNPKAILVKGYKGYKDTIKLDNDARGEGDEIEVIHGHVKNNEFLFPGELAGTFMKTVEGVRYYIYNFEDASHAGADIDFLSLQTMSYAQSVGLPRLRQEGTLNVPANLVTIPMLMSFGNVAYIVETYDWDLVNEEVKVSDISLPAASITIDKETVSWLDKSYSGTSKSSSSGGSSSGGAFPVGDGVSMRQVWRSLSNDQTLTDYGDSTLIAAAHLASLFTVETRTSGANTYYYLKLNTTYEGLVSAGYITAGAAASASDARLKEKIRTIQPEKALEFLALLRGCEWVWNGKHPSLEGQRGSGLIAQEVQKVMPWAVLDFDGELSLNYNSFWGIAIPVMQAQQRRIEKLERRVAQLEKAIDSILSKDDGK